MKGLGVVLFSFISCAYGHSESTETCHGVNSKLVLFEMAMFGPTAPIVANMVQSATGIEMLSVTYLEQFTCPWLESESIDDVGQSMRSSGLLRVVVENMCSFMSVQYGHFKRAYPVELAMQHMSVAGQELLQAGLDAMEHLEDMGYMNLNPEGFGKAKEFFLMSSGFLPGVPSSAVIAYPGNPSAYNGTLRWEIILQDVQTLITKARVATDDYWDMITVTVNMYSGGLINLDDEESVNSLVRDIADVDSLGGMYEFISSTVLMPLLNFYYPQLDMALTQVNERLQGMVARAEEVVENGFASPEYLEDAQRKASTFAALYSAITATGVLNVHW